MEQKLRKIAKTCSPTSMFDDDGRASLALQLSLSSALPLSLCESVQQLTGAPVLGFQHGHGQ